jgi:hypothetical protein
MTGMGAVTSFLSMTPDFTSMFLLQTRLITFLLAGDRTVESKLTIISCSTAINAPPVGGVLLSDYLKGAQWL